MILVNTDYITGKELEMLGLVKGSTIQSKNVGRDITQSLKTLVGGELKAYNEMMTEARALATKRMVMEAESMGAEMAVTAGKEVKTKIVLRCPLPCNARTVSGRLSRSQRDLLCDHLWNCDPV